MPMVTGRIVEYYSGRGVPDVLVRVGGKTTVTDFNGVYRINIPEGEYRIDTRKTGFAPVTTDKLVFEGATSLTVDDIAIRQTMVRAL